MLKLSLICIALLLMSSPLFAKHLIGHFFEWNGQISHVQTEDLTHLVYNHYELSEDASINEWDPERMVKHLPSLLDIKNKQPNLTMLASIGGWALSENYPLVLSDKEKTKRFVKHVGRFVHESVFDGVSIDWRYPGVSRESTVGDRDEDGNNLLSLLTQLRLSYPSMPLVVTVSVLTDDLAYLPLLEMSKHVDIMEVLTLDLAGHWQNHTGHSSPLYSSPDNPSIFTSSVDEAIRYIVNQNVPPNKLVISVPAFGHGWLGVNPENDGLFQASQSIPAGDYTVLGRANTGLYKQASIHGLFFTEHYQTYWDDVAQASYLFNPRIGHFISFESTRSLKEKMEYIFREQLAGVSIQNLDADASLVAQAAHLMSKPYDESGWTGRHILSIFVWFTIGVVILGLSVFWYRVGKKQRKDVAEMTKELFSLELKLENVEKMSEDDQRKMGDHLKRLQNKYGITLDEDDVSMQIEQMLEHVDSKVRQMSHDPSLLSELHTIISNKNKLLYIRAENGYTGLYLNNVPHPTYIYSRLKQLKHYYDDDFLVQIHRSCLVNANRVTQAKEGSDGKFYVLVGDKFLPIGGSYLVVLKHRHSEWFR